MARQLTLFHPWVVNRISEKWLILYLMVNFVVVLGTNTAPVTTDDKIIDSMTTKYGFLHGLSR